MTPIKSRRKRVNSFHHLTPSYGANKRSFDIQYTTHDVIVTFFNSCRCVCECDIYNIDGSLAGLVLGSDVDFLLCCYYAAFIDINIYEVVCMLMATRGVRGDVFGCHNYRVAPESWNFILF